MKRLVKISSGIILTICSLNGFAADKNSQIAVTVHTNTPGVAAIGCKVGKTDFGGPGNSYVCKGPGNKTYLFGFRKKVNGPNISCGSLKLNKNSDVSLSMNGNKCKSVLNH